MAVAHARSPDAPPATLKRERLAAGVNEIGCDTAVGGARREDNRIRVSCCCNWRDDRVNEGVEPTWGRSGCDTHLTCVQSAVYDSSSDLEDAVGALW